MAADPVRRRRGRETGTTRAEDVRTRIRFNLDPQHVGGFTTQAGEAVQVERAFAKHIKQIIQRQQSFRGSQRLFTRSLNQSRRQALSSLRQ